MGSLDYRNDVSIALIVIYVPALLIATFLAIKHGMGRSSGWIYLILFCLARIIGPAMQLTTISLSPPSEKNEPLDTGSAILQNIGLSPLMLAALGFLSRLLSSISKAHHTAIHPRMIQALQIIIIVALILGIVGGVDAATNYENIINAGGKALYHPTTLNKAGTSLFVVSYAILVGFVAITFPSVQHAEAGEKRLFLAVALSLPFILVRLVYSCLSTFANKRDFNLLDGNVTILLCVALIEEIICVIIYEATGLTLHKLRKEEHVEATTQLRNEDDAQAQSEK